MGPFKKLTLVAFLGAGAYLAAGRYQANRPKPTPVELLHPMSFVVVYGTEECGFCQGMRKGLTEAGVPFDWRPLTDQEYSAQAVARMQRAGLNTSSFDLPVVDVNGDMLIRPAVSDVAARYLAQADSKNARR